MVAVVADALEHGAELLALVVFEAEGDGHALEHFPCPVTLLVVLLADVQVVAYDVVEALR